jgi:hypothetical protein
MVKLARGRLLVVFEEWEQRDKEFDDGVWKQKELRW